MRMIPTAFAIILSLFPTAFLRAQDAGDETAAIEQAISQLAWVNGPGDVELTARAQVTLPEGFSYLGTRDTAVLMEFFENPNSEGEYFVGPDDWRWWAVFSYDDTGYVKDDEEIDADALLESLRAGNDIANEERRARGWSELRIVGWQYPPFYDPETHHLSWAVLAQSGDARVVNYNTRLLGRTGVMSATLVADPEVLDASVTEFKDLLNRFSYVDGQRYAEFRPGDKVAAYGLAALVAGGAAAAVAKSGAGKGLIKMAGAAILAGFAAVAGVVKRLFGKKHA